jgi:aminopeptidase N
MREATPRTIRREDYTPPPYFVEHADLGFELGDPVTRVEVRLSLRRNPALPPGPLVLDGQELELKRVAVDGRELAPHEYTLTEDHLDLGILPERCTVETSVEIRPGENTSLEGLYLSSGNFCTQCEAEGFRKITFCPDRPDVMARFSTTLSADPTRYPVLLSNGNPVARGELPDGRHFVTWEDPFPKPCYLFALVAGNLASLEDTFTTASGREVKLEIWVEPRNAEKCGHAMHSLKQAMAWDERVFGREYDLDIYMIVAVDDFNMGAMENKGLNVFNSKYVLAQPETATDEDYEGIEAVIAHEYFHNWSGNRVTCRDWFQLSLKEGFTVFRDQQFTADMTSRAVKRIKDVNLLRTFQFREDGGPLAHPVRPDAYQEINNFYTLTVYEKGAEVVRMLHTLLGPEGFRRGTDRYFERFDGQAVTCDDFVQALEEATGRDLSRFRRWYSQAGTPVLGVSGHHDPRARTYTLTVTQHTPPTPGQPDKLPLHIPFAVGLVGPDGVDLPLRLAGEAGAGAGTRVLELTEAEHTFIFEEIGTAPVPSLLRGYSAPVKLRYDYSDAELAFLMAHDTDEFNRWDAGQRLAERVITRLMADYRDGRPLQLDEGLLAAYRKLLEDPGADRRLLAQALMLPSEAYLAEQSDAIDPEAIHNAREFLRHALAQELRPILLESYHAHRDADYRVSPEAIGRRRLKNVCLGYLMALHDEVIQALCMTQYREADNMTDAMAALAALAQVDIPGRIEALAHFHGRWRDDPLVMDKWLALQATSSLPGTLEEVKRLTRHPAFNLRNPNKVRALIGAFASGNPVRFHDPSGAGYLFLADRVLELDPLNPQVAARLLTPLTQWRRYEPGRRALMAGELKRVLATPQLSKDVYEIASKALGEGA